LERDFALRPKSASSLGSEITRKTTQVYANITGVWASDRSSANGKYLIIGSEGTEFSVTDGKGIYETNQQIIVSKLSSILGEKATTTSKTLTFDDENPVPALRKLQVDYPNAAIYLSGAIGVDAPEDLELVGWFHCRWRKAEKPILPPHF